METVQSVYFCFGAKPANSTFATKAAKKKSAKIVIETLDITIPTPSLAVKSKCRNFFD